MLLSLAQLSTGLLLGHPTVGVLIPSFLTLSLLVDGQKFFRIRLIWVVEILLDIIMIRFAFAPAEPHNFSAQVIDFGLKLEAMRIEYGLSLVLVLLIVVFLYVSHEELLTTFP